MALGAPVNRLDWLSQVLSKTEKTASDNFVEALKRSTNQLRKIMKELASVVNIHTTNSLESQSFDFRESIADTIDLIKSQLNQKIVVQYVVDDEVPNQLSGRNIYFTQIIYGLITHAVRHHSNAQIHFSINVDQTQESVGQLQIRIIEKFAPLTTSNHPTIDESSLQLQLEVVKKLIELQKGNIALKPVNEEGEIQLLCYLPYELPGTG